MTQLQTLPARDYLRFLGDDALKVTYSQLGEDAIVHHLLIHKVRKLEGGFYVDVGAYHPRSLSNTKFLNILGWRGLNIDASEAAIAAFQQERPNDINVCSGVALEDGELAYYKFGGVAAANTLSRETAERWQQEQGWTLTETVMIPVRPLNAILNEHLPAGQEIDYMNVDIEGLDNAVIETFDFDKFRPKIISIELHGADLSAPKETPAVAHLLAQGYVLASINLITFIFVDGRLG
ncbi:FkbM family methyltransferase [Caulobacter sp. 73W]|uniref:FkbM family methyltransferase n=1 Tax=Caulobacter sp. 73W TaxID=3161137 RepID=A0AB39KVZ3_9CAUL